MLTSISDELRQAKSSTPKKPKPNTLVMIVEKEKEKLS